MANKPMKMKKCKHCGCDMFYYAKACPHCGKYQSSLVAKYIFLGCIVVAIVAMALIVGSGSPLGHQLDSLLKLGVY